MEFKNTKVWGFEHALRSIRIPKNSWNKSDSHYGCDNKMDCEKCRTGDEGCVNYKNNYIIGEDDMKIVQTLIKAEPKRRKFMKHIMVSVDIVAPLYWWNTYKIGKTTDSISAMYKLTTMPITLESFETDDYDKTLSFADDSSQDDELDHISAFEEDVIMVLENLRQKYLKTKDERY